MDLENAVPTDDPRWAAICYEHSRNVPYRESEKNAPADLYPNQRSFSNKADAGKLAARHNQHYHQEERPAPNR